MVKYSIIVPVYNIEKYISECITSVIKQSYKNYELLLVDDGSLDNSGTICDEYAEKYENIKVIHKKNGGLSDARNAGIDKAMGEYILFLDGDDTLCDDCLNIINSRLSKKKIDLLSCSFCVYGEKDIIKKKQLSNIISLNDYIELLGDIPWSAWRNVYRTELFKLYNLKYKNGLIGAEDCEFFIRFFEKASIKKYYNICLVNYRVNRDGSITNKISYNAIIGELNVFSKYFYKFYKLGDVTLYTLFANKYLNTITTINSISNNVEMNSILKHIEDNKFIFKFSSGFKYIVAKFIWKIFGYRLGTKIIRIIK